MDNLLYYALIFITTYLLGAIPNAYLTVKLFTGKNVMEHGTKNVGTMNSHRTTNNKFVFLLTLLLEIGKGIVAYFLVKHFINAQNLDSIIALSLGLSSNVLGHNHSIFLKFKGGKGLATAAGFLLFANPIYVLVWIIGFLVTTIIWKYMVLGQIVGTVSLPLYYLIHGIAEKDFSDFWIVLPGCILIFIAHAPRINNLMKGTEPKMYYKERSDQPKKTKK